MSNEPKISMSIAKIDKMVLSGGGLRGCIYVGMLRYFEETGIIRQIKHIAGTSIGALIATLICIGFTSDELNHVLKHFDYVKYQSVDIFCMFEKFGIDNFEKIGKFIELLFITKKLSPSITFIELYEKTNIHLVVNSVCLNTRESIFFNYMRTPKMFVMTAVQASMSLPYVFASVNCNGLTFVDGGVLNNFPYNLFIDDPSSIFGIRLHNPINYSIKEIKSIDQFSMQLFSCIHDAYIDLADKPHHDSHIISISIPKFNTYDFNLTDQDKQLLVEIGHQKTKDYFEIHLPKKIAEQEMSLYEETEDDTILLNRINQYIDIDRSDNAKKIVNYMIKRKSEQSLEKKSIEKRPI